MSGVAALSPSRDAAIGVAAENLAISVLLRRGHKVAVPVVDDDGVDLIVDYRLRVQVKSSSRRVVTTNPPYSYAAYMFSGLNKSLGKVEFFLFHGVGDDGTDRWWVVPAAALAGCGPSVNIYEGSVRGTSARLMAYENAWELLDGDEGISVASDGSGATEVAGVGGSVVALF